MRKALVSMAVAACALGVVPAPAATVTRTIQVPVAGTYGASYSTQYINAYCISQETGSPERCANNLRTGEPTDQKLVYGDMVTVERGGTARVHRCVYTTDAPTAQNSDGGIFGYTVNIPSSARGETFTLRSASSNAAEADFDIVFYESLGSCSNGAGTVGAAPAPDAPATHSGVGNESGRIPGYAEVALVTMFAGAPGSSFVFTY